MRFEFDKDKDRLLLKARGISFYEIIESIAENGVLLDIEHPNKEKYPDQFMFVVEYDNYTYCVPYTRKGEVILMKTIYPNRDFMYLLREARQ